MSGLIKQRWLQILFGGIVLFAAMEQTMVYTQNLNYAPSVILLGAFLVPLSFVAYFYSKERTFDKGMHGGSILLTAVLCFFIGGAIGVLFAGFLEYATLTSFSFVNLIYVGLIEETAKIIFPIAIFLRGRFRSEMDGILFGVASGMGFAALETMGYGLVAFLETSGDIASLRELLLVRGLLSPAGHAAWTGLLAAAIWREHKHTSRIFSLSVLGYFALAAGLHTLWNTVSSVDNMAITLAGYVVIASTGVTVLVLRYREARRHAIEERAAEGDITR